MGARLSRSGADGAGAPAEGGDDAGAPAEGGDGALALDGVDPKRHREASGIIERVFERDDNLSRVLGFAGFTAVYAVETLSKPAHLATRAAKLAIEVQLGKGEQSWRAACICAARDELLKSRRAGRFQDSPMMYSFYRGDGFQSATSDVVYDGGAVYVRSTAGSLSKSLLPHEGVGCTDQIRSAAAHASAEQHRLALLKIGVLHVDYSHCHGDTAGEHGQRELRRMMDKRDPEKVRKRDGAEAASLIDAMGGSLGIPRQLVDAAHRRDPPGFFLTASHLTSAIDSAADASAVLDKLSMERLLVAYVWDTFDESDFKMTPCSQKRFVRVCRGAGISEESGEAVWLEATEGVLCIFSPCFLDEHLRVYREPGDVREGDVSALIVLDLLWPAICAFAVTSRCGGDPHRCFSIENEALFIRQNGSRFHTFYGNEWYLPLFILEALSERRRGEESDGPGRRRVEEALDSLLTTNRVKPPLVVGASVDFCSRWVNEDAERTWIRATILGFRAERKVSSVKVRLEDTGEVRRVPRVHLRSLEEPSAAAVVLALAVARNCNRVVAHLLAHPLMRDSLSVVVGSRWSAMAPRNSFRATAIDHAILNNNIVGIGLLLALYPRLTFDISIISAATLQLHFQNPEMTRLLPRADLAGAFELFNCLLPEDYRSPRPSRYFQHLTRPEMEALSEVTADVVRVRRALVAAVQQARHRRAPSLLGRSQRADAIIDVAEMQTTIDDALACSAKLGLVGTLRDIWNLRDDVKHDWGWALRKVLEIAASEGHADCVSFSLAALMTLGAPVGASGDDQLREAIVRRAAVMGYGKVLDALRDNGVSLAVAMSELQQSPLELAAMYGQPEAAAALIRDPDVSRAVRERRSTAFFWACRYGNASTLEVILEAEGVTISCARDIDLPLQDASFNGHVDVVRALLRQPAVDVNYAPEGKKSPLMCAAENNHLHVAELLFAAGGVTGSMTRRVDERSTAYDYAIFCVAGSCEGRLSMIKLFLRNKGNSSEPTLLDTICRGHGFPLVDFVGLAELFVEIGTDLLAENSAGLTAFSFACFQALVCDGYAEEYDYRWIFLLVHLIRRGASLDAATTAVYQHPVSNTDSIEIPAGTTPRGIVASFGTPERRDKVQAAITAAFAMRALAA